jgi:dipeptidase D
MTSVLDGLEPALLWERFSELTRIARPPKHEELAARHVRAWAESRGYEANGDAEGNVVVRVASSVGREEADTVVLQSHLDMVCERDPDSAFDPREGRIDVQVDGDWVLANGTTLGADNGIGVAAAMAVADDPGVAHGPLELLFTVSEEQGLDGAKALDPALVSGRVLLNLDGTSDESLTVGCAGSDHTFVRLPLAPAPTEAAHVVLEVALSGAKGGHSGGEIAVGRTNAIKALGRVLGAAFDITPFRLARFEGGVSRNAIPRAARAVVALRAADVSAFRAAVEGEIASVRRQYAGTDDGLAVELTAGAVREAADAETTRRALDLVNALPTGVVAMTPSLPGVVETSISLTVAATEDDVLVLASMARSSNASALDELLQRLTSIARLGGASIEIRRSYPPWEPQLDSHTLATATSTFERLFGSPPGLAVVHGGLECAVLGERLPGASMISIGPELVGPHAPGEKVRISSVQRFYALLGALLDDLSN